MQNKSQETLLNSKQAASYLGTQLSWVRYAVFHKVLPYIKVGRHVRFKKAHLDQWIKEQTITKKEL